MTTLKFADTHNMVAFLAKPAESEGFEQIVDFLNAHTIKYALTINPTIYTSCIEQFWATVNGEVQLQALVDGKKIIITESIVRRDLQLEDAEGVDCLPNATIFEQLTLMGYEKISQKLTFYKAFFSPQWKFLIHTILQCLSSKTTAWNEFSSTMASAIICLATNQKFNFSKYIFESMVKNLENVSGRKIPESPWGSPIPIGDGDGDQLQALVDGKKIIITEATVRRDLQLEDANGVDCLPNAASFEQLTLMGAKTTAWNEFSSTMASAIICLATNQKFNFSKYIFESMVKNLDNAVKFLMYPRFVQVFLNNQLEGMATHNRIYIAPSHTKKIFANMRRQGKDFSGRVTPLFPTMVVQAQEEMGEGSAMPTDPHHTPIITQPSSSQPQRKQKSRRPKEKDTEIPQSSVPSDPTNVVDEAVNEEPSMQLKELMDFCTKLQQRVLDLENTKTAQAQEITSLKKRVKKLEKKGGSRTHKLKRLYRVGRSARVVSSEEASLGDQEDASKQGRKIYNIDADEDITLENVHDAKMFDVNDLDSNEVIVDSEVTDKAGKKRNIIEEAVVVTDVVTIPVSAATITNVELTLSQTLAELKSARPKIKGLVMQEPSYRQNFNEEDRLGREKAQQAQEQHELTIKEKSTLFVQLLEKRKKHFAAKREVEKRNIPPTRAQQRNIMVNTFVDFRTKLVEGTKMEESSKKAEVMEESSSKRVGDEL
ncbi:hypothetical protein Tco_1210109 [Tanacetum coccineum]